MSTKNSDQWREAGLPVGGQLDRNQGLACGKMLERVGGSLFALKRSGDGTFRGGPTRVNLLRVRFGCFVRAWGWSLSV